MKRKHLQAASRHRAQWITGSALGLFCLSTNALAQSCNDNIKASTPDQRFQRNIDNSLTDKTTGLQWAACSFGQRWDNGVCLGEAHKLPFAIASLVVEDGWRIPHLNELSALVELSCIYPAINTRVFPSSLPAPYWTATRFVNTDGYYWQVNFIHGESGSAPADTGALLRLVRKVGSQDKQ
ncbi:MAG: DUF1566 domain-containing protein [Ectothiorhodospiraceae bacterium]|nr:DUF1566 domain-containing protein [Ectothiorhodospiraceae bacterium]